MGTAAPRSVRNFSREDAPLSGVAAAKQDTAQKGTHPHTAIRGIESGRGLAWQEQQHEQQQQQQQQQHEQQGGKSGLLCHLVR